MVGMVVGRFRGLGGSSSAAEPGWGKRESPKLDGGRRASWS